jgi:hypothetical protein
MKPRQKNVEIIQILNLPSKFAFHINVFIFDTIDFV